MGAVLDNLFCCNYSTGIRRSQRNVALRRLRRVCFLPCWVSGEKNRRQSGVTTKSQRNFVFEISVRCQHLHLITAPWPTPPSFTLCLGFSLLVPVDFRFSNFASWFVTTARSWINWPVVGCPFCFRFACCKYVPTCEEWAGFRLKAGGQLTFM